MIYGSVCSGIEAASVAWHPLGWKAAWFAEIEPFPSAVLAHRYPEVPNLGDMTQIAKRVLLGEIQAPDLLVGGTPCQAFSVAGMREGLTDPRGALTIKYVELADAVDYVRVRRGQEPSIVVWENVPGVLSDKGNAFGCFLGALAGEGCELQPPGGKWNDAGCVYGPTRSITWRVLDAQYFGLAQRRRRVFVIASARDGFDPAAVLFEREGVRRDTAPSRGAGQGAAGGAAEGVDSNGIQRTVGTLCADTHPGAYSGQDAYTGRLVPVARQVAPGENAVCVTGNITHTLKAEGFDGSEDGAENAVLSVALRGRDGGATAELGDDVAGCLRASSGGGDKPHALVRSSVRRLTPVECERLQGFPDTWTMIPWRGKPGEQCPDGPRYKAIGNSKAVPVVRWIGRRIAAVTGSIAGVAAVE